MVTKIYTISRGGGKKYYVEVFSRSLWSHYKHRVYHWYDLNIPVKVPGWIKFRDWIGKHGAQPYGYCVDDPKPRLRDRVYRWDISQDFRCYKLSEKGKTISARIEVDEETFNKI